MTKLKTDHLDTPEMYLYFDNGVMKGHYKKGIFITMDVAKKIVNDRLKFFNGHSYAILIKDLGVVGIEKKARDFLSSEEGVQGIKASALVLNSMFSKWLGNFIVKVTGPKIPVKIFTDEILALNWLRKYT